MMLLLLLFMILSFHCKLSFAQLTLEVYNNSALVVSVDDRVQQQQQQELINSLTNVTIHNPSTLTTTSTTTTSPPPFSARIQGILNLSNYSYLQGFIFDCSSLYNNNNISGAFIWIDDHLICQESVCNNNTHSYQEAMDGSSTLPLRKLRKANLTIRIHLWSNSNDISFSLRWYVIPNKSTTTSSKDNNGYSNNNNNNKQNISNIQYTDIPSNLFSPNISKFENQRLQLTENLNQGWNTWLLHSIMDFILLPEGIQIGIRICQNNNNHQYTDSNSISNSTTTTAATNNNKNCLTSAIPTDRNVRVTSPIIVVPPSTGNNSNDDSVGRTYMKYHVMTSFGVNVTITMSSVQHNLNNNKNNKASSSSNDLLSKDLPSQEGEVDDRLWILIETITCPDDDDDDDDCSNNYSIHLIGDIAYIPFRSGYVQPTSQGGINITATGLRSIIVHPTTSDNNEISSSSSTSSEATSSSRNYSRILKKNSIDDDHNNNHVGDDDDHINEIVIPLPGVGRYVGFTTDPFPLPSASMMKQRLQQIEQDEINKHTKRFNSIIKRSPAGTNNGHNNNNSTMMLVETLMAVQAGVLYNLIYTPAELSPITVVSRNWWYRKEIFRSDMDYIIFNWDTVLASYLLGKTTSKQISYSNLIQVVKSKTANGFIPNYSANGAKSQDRTEPPLAAKVLYELYQEYDDTWIVELLWDDIADYIDWFDRERVLSPFNLIALGSNPFDYVNATSPHNMQGARYESGLDNSPMYDGNCYDPKTNVMQMYDVGMTSLYIQECDYLSKLASIIGNDKGHTEMKSRANTMRKKLLHHLWDPKQKIFVNRYRNGTYSNRISPTSFYPLGVLLNDGIHYLNNDDDDDGDIHDKASYMIQHWLFNRSRFCIDVNWPNNDGDGFHSGNSDDCWWGLPSISADDPAFPKLGYWRGYVWGPMAQLTYWSLQLQQQQQRQQQSSTTAASTSATSSSIDNYRILAKQARKALSNQMGELFLTMWRRHAHICENYSPHKDDAAEEDCTGDTFYHWGGLAGLLVLLEAAEEEEIIVEEEVDDDESSTTLVEGMVMKSQ